MLDCTLKFFYTQYMFTLSDASRTFKEILKWGGLIFAAIILVFMLWKILLYVKSMFFPSSPEKPAIAFGQLQAQIFPENIVNQNFSYSLNTLSGQFPSFPLQARVYRIGEVQPDLLALSKFDKQAAIIGFNSGYTALSDKVFEWKGTSNASNLERRLRFNVVTHNFTIVSPYLSDPSVLSSANLPNEQNAKSLAQTSLQNMEILPQDIDLSKTKTNLFSIRNGALVKATSLSNTQIIEVNLFQKDINGLPILYEKPNSSNISILIGGGENQGQIVAANFIYQKITNESSTYPIKSVTTAFNELKQKKGYIGAYDGTSNNILINNIFLAYYVGSQPQDFLMPIFVFSGNDGFFAYVPAITDESISK